MDTYVPFNGGVALIACGSPAVAALLELFDIGTNHFQFHDRS